MTQEAKKILVNMFCDSHNIVDKADVRKYLKKYGGVTALKLLRLEGEDELAKKLRKLSNKIDSLDVSTKEGDREFRKLDREITDMCKGKNI